MKGKKRREIRKKERKGIKKEGKEGLPKHKQKTHAGFGGLGMDNSSFGTSSFKSPPLLNRSTTKSSIC